MFGILNREFKFLVIPAPVWSKLGRVVFLNFLFAPFRRPVPGLVNFYSTRVPI